jgi:hypothetical protein
MVLLTRRRKGPRLGGPIRRDRFFVFGSDTTLSLILFTDGGAVDVGVKHSAVTKNRHAGRSHLPHIAMTFGAGNFDATIYVRGGHRKIAA